MAVDSSTLTRRGQQQMMTAVTSASTLPEGAADSWAAATQQQQQAAAAYPHPHQADYSHANNAEAANAGGGVVDESVFQEMLSPTGHADAQVWSLTQSIYACFIGGGQGRPSPLVNYTRNQKLMNQNLSNDETC